MILKRFSSAISMTKRFTAVKSTDDTIFHSLSLLTPELRLPWYSVVGESPGCGANSMLLNSPLSSNNVRLTLNCSGKVN